MNHEAAEQLRASIATTRQAINKLKEDVPQDQASLVIPELVLANRHLEDARMRVGVAIAYSKGIDPWANRVEEK